MPELLVSPDYKPFTPTLHAGVFAMRFPGNGTTLLTFINRTETLASPRHRSGGLPAWYWRFFDAWRGLELSPEVSGSSATLSFEIDVRGYGAVLATAAEPDATVKTLLSG